MAQRKFFRVEDFSGGWNPDRSPLLIEDNQAQELVNFRLDRSGSLVSRQGLTRLVESPYAGNIRGLGSWRDQQNPDLYKLLFAQNGRVYEFDVGGGETRQVGNTLAGNVPVSFFPMQDKVMVAGGFSPLLYDGQRAYKVGLEPPAYVSYSKVPNGSPLTGEYSYVFVHVDTTTGRQSNPSEPENVTLNGEMVIFSLITPSNGTNRLKVYRKGPEDVTYLQIADQTSLTNVVEDGLEATAITPVYDNTPPPNFSNVAYHAGYVFGSVNDTLYWSKPLNPHAYPANNSTKVPFEGNDSITALVSHKDTLLVFGRQNVLLLTGQAGNWSLRRVDVRRGTFSKNTVTEADGVLYFLDREGIYEFPSFTPVTPHLSRHLSRQPPTRFDSVALVHVPDERSLWVVFEDETYSTHLPNQAVTRYTFGTSHILPGGRDGFSTPLLARGGSLLEYTGETDEGSPIPLRWVSKTFQLTPEMTKHFRRITAYASAGSDASVTVSIQDRSGIYTVTLTSSGVGEDELVWDEGNWDEKNWASEGLSTFVGSLPAQTLIGQTFEVVISATVEKRTELIPPITFEYRESNRFIGR